MFRAGADAVYVLDTQPKLPALNAGQIISRKGRPSVTDMQPPGRAWGEARHNMLGATCGIHTDS